MQIKQRHGEQRVKVAVGKCFGGRLEKNGLCFFPILNYYFLSAGSPPSAREEVAGHCCIYNLVAAGRVLYVWLYPCFPGPQPCRSHQGFNTTPGQANFLAHFVFFLLKRVTQSNFFR